MSCRASQIRRRAMGSTKRSPRRFPNDLERVPCPSPLPPFNKREATERDPFSSFPNLYFPEDLLVHRALVRYLSSFQCPFPPPLGFFFPFFPFFVGPYGASSRPPPPFPPREFGISFLLSKSCFISRVFPPPLE